MVVHRRLACLLLLACAAACSGSTEPSLVSFDCVEPFQVIALGQSIPARCIIGFASNVDFAPAIEWTSSTPGIVSFGAAPPGLDAGTTITAMAAGTTSIRASYRGKEVILPLTVLATGGPSLRIEPNPIELAVGDKITDSCGPVSQSFCVTPIDGDGTPRTSGTGWFGFSRISSDYSVAHWIGITSTTTGGTGDHVITTYYLYAASPGTADFKITYAGVTATVPVIVK